MREDLRRPEDDEARRSCALAEIEEAIREGIASGVGTLDLDAIVAEAERRAGRRR